MLLGDFFNCLLDWHDVHLLENAYLVAMDIRIVLEHLAESTLLDQGLESIEFVLVFDMVEELNGAVNLLAAWTFPAQ